MHIPVHASVEHNSLQIVKNILLHWQIFLRHLFFGEGDREGGRPSPAP